ncbi:MAG: response regulator transcription factor [Chloroflexales bacterium]|nr:response regulator transcription factor [Chloroflexales bacterium]
MCRPGARRGAHAGRARGAGAPVSRPRSVPRPQPTPAPPDPARHPPGAPARRHGARPPGRCPRHRNHSGGASASALSPQPLVEPLSARELEVLALLAAGATNQQIGDQLLISERTAKKHVINILGKLNAANRTQAVALARAVGLIP